MQLKSITLLAASLALVQAGTWADNQPSGGVGKPSTPVEGGEKPPVSPPTGKPSTPVEGGEKPPVSPPTGKPSTPVEGGEKPPVGPPTGKPSIPVEGGSTSVADETVSPTWSDVSSIVATETSSSTWADVTSISTPVADTTSEPSYWGDETSVADETTTSSAEATWSDVTSDPVLPTTTSEVSYWGDETSVADETTTSSAEATWSDVTSDPVLPTTTSEASYWGDETSVADETTTSSADHTWSDYTTPTETPVSGDEGKPAPPAGGHCGLVYETVVNTVTVTVPPGKPTTSSAPAPPVAVTTEAPFTWGDASTLITATKAAPTGASSGGYMGVVEEWRAKLGLSDLTQDSQLQSNAQDTANSSGGQLKHKLNPGSMAQVLAPGNADNFQSVFVGGWLCEMPGLPGLGSSVCSEFSKGWDYAGQTGHAKILTSPSYSKIGCALGDGIWACDLA